MADTKTPMKVEFVVNDETESQVDFSALTSVEVRGATGAAIYRLDPLQDVVIKLVVTGTPVPEDPDSDEVPLPAESVVGYLGTSENVEGLKEREKKVKEDKEKADKEAAEGQKEEKAEKTEKTEPVKAEPVSTATKK